MVVVTHREKFKEQAAHRPVLMVDGEAEAGEVEPLFLIRVAAFAWNCPQFITPRYTAAQLADP
jgi:hypothetical protein